MFPATPDRANRVNHEPSGQTISASNFSFPGLTTAERSTFGKQFRPGSAVNRAIDSATAEQRRICGIHNSVDFELRDVATDNVDFGGRGQSVSDRSSGSSRRQSPVYFLGRSLVPDDNTIEIPLPTN